MKTFLAVCRDNMDNENQFYYTVYFVNNSNEDIKLLAYETWAYMTDGDDLIETNLFKESLGPLSAKEFIKIENDDEGSFDFVINFLFKITYATGVVDKKLFRIDKYLSNGVENMSIPLLNIPGHIFKVI